MATSRKELAQSEFRRVDEKIDTHIDQIISNENYLGIQELNKENDDIYSKYSKTENNQEIGYDMTTFKQDTKNTGKILSALHKMTLKGYESKSFKFNWSEVVLGMKRINNFEDENVSVSKNLNRDHWHECAKRLCLFKDISFPASGFSATYFHCHAALSSLDKQGKVKKEKKELTPHQKEAKAKNEAAKKRAEQKITDAADEQADVQEDYDQKDGQISTAVLQKCLITIANELRIKKVSKIEYWRAVICPKSFAKSVENMFHVSFLIKQGDIGIVVDRFGIPYLTLLHRGELKSMAARDAVDLDETANTSNNRRSKPENKKARLSVSTTINNSLNESNATIGTAARNGKPAQGVVMLDKEGWQSLIECLGLTEGDSSLFDE